MDDILGRILALLALAGSSNEHEAVAASIQAVRLIRQHKVTLALPPENRGASMPDPADISGWGVDLISVLEPFRKVKAKFEGRCSGCSKRIAPNSIIMWAARRGAYHPKCFETAQP